MPVQTDDGPVGSAADGAASGTSASGLPQGQSPQIEDTSEGTVPDAGAEEYTWDHSVTVDGGRELTLRLHCRAEDYGCGVRAIDVLDGGELLQTLSVQEASLEADRDQGLEDVLEGTEYTACWDEDGDLYVEDLNFDGSGDLRLLEFTGVVNSRYLCWLWDPEAGQFDYAFPLVGYDIQTDSDTEQIVTESRDGIGLYDTDYYECDTDGVLRHVKQVHVDYTDRSEGEDCYVITTRELIDGAWVETDRQAVPNPLG